MNYAVTWVPSAQDALLRIVISRPDREAVVSALDRIGRILAREGPAAGESRDQDLRLLFVLPLAALTTGPPGLTADREQSNNPSMAQSQHH